MTKKWICECDLCGAQMRQYENYILEFRPELPQNQVGTVESWDICPECKGILLEFFKTRKNREPQTNSEDIPIFNVHLATNQTGSNNLYAEDENKE